MPSLPALSGHGSMGEEDISAVRNPACLQQGAGETQAWNGYGYMILGFEACHSICQSIPGTAVAAVG